MIGLSNKVFVITGNLILHELDSNVNNSSRRVTKTKTLDGEVAVEDRGYTPKDRTFTIRVTAEKVLREKLLEFISLYSTLTLTMEDGGFDVIATSFDLKTNIFVLNFMAR